MEPLQIQFKTGWHFHATSDNICIQKHDYDEVIVVTNGRMSVQVGEQQWLTEAGSVLYYPPHTQHIEQSDGTHPVECYVLNFYWHPPRLPPSLVIDRHGRLRMLTEWFFRDIIEWRDEPEPAAIQYMLAGILGQLIKASAAHEHPLVSATRRYIADHLADRITLKALADNADLSISHFTHKYHELTGRAPMRDARMQRLERACVLINQTDLPLKTIARKVGVGDEFQLSRMLKRYLGLHVRDLRER